MIKSPFFILFFLILFGPGVCRAAALPVDSIGVEMRNGKNYVVHKVVPKETLFALSRKYHVPVDRIVDANPKIESGLRVGQLVYIPRNAPAAVTPPKTVTAGPVPAKTTPAPAATPAASPRTFVVDDKGNKIHQVAEKQTLYSISRLYGVSVADIKKWNSLASDQVSVGSQLIVGIGNKPTASPQYSQEPDDDVEKVKDTATKPVISTPKKVEEPVVTPPKKVEEPVAATPKKMGEPVATTPKKAEEPVVKAPSPAPARNQPPVAAKTPPPAPSKEEERESESETENISKITETGLAEVIDNRNDNNKYLALHKSAPVGTILQVKNLMNGQSVYVRVIGHLPNTGVNEKVIIRISSRAYQKLAALDSRFRVEVSYMP